MKHKTAVDFATQIAKELNVEGSQVIVVVGVPDANAPGGGMAGFGFHDIHPETAISMLANCIAELSKIVMKERDEMVAALNALTLGEEAPENELRH